MDVTIHNALLEETPELVNIGIENGQIVKISTDALPPGEQSFDAKGRLVIPPFFESHFHLDNLLIWGLKLVLLMKKSANIGSSPISTL